MVVYIAVENRLDAVGAQTFGQSENALAVLVGIVAVAEEDDRNRAGVSGDGLDHGVSAEY